MSKTGHYTGLQCHGHRYVNKLAQNELIVMAESCLKYASGTGEEWVTVWGTMERRKQASLDNNYYARFCK